MTGSNIAPPSGIVGTAQRLKATLDAVAAAALEAGAIQPPPPSQADIFNARMQNGSAVANAFRQGVTAPIVVPKTSQFGTSKMTMSR